MPEGWVPPLGWAPPADWPVPDGWAFWAVAQPEKSAGIGRSLFGGKQHAEELEQARADLAAQGEQLAAAEARVRQLEPAATQFEGFRQWLDGAGQLTVADTVTRLNTAATQIRGWIEDLRATEGQERARINAELAPLTSAIAAQKAELATLSERAIDLRDMAGLQETGLYNYEHPAENSVALKADLDSVQEAIKAAVKDKTAVSFNPNSFTFNNSTTEGAKFVKDFATLMLRAYNAEAENSVKSMRAGNLDSAIKRLTSARDTISKLGDRMSIRVSDRYHQLRIQELDIASRYYAAVEAKKEAEREERARLREEAAVLKEAQAKLAKLEKERAHYANALQQMAQQPGADTAELQAQLAAIDSAIAGTNERVANTRAGYVYVISNIGAFGERVVKIGMTRREEPDHASRNCPAHPSRSPSTSTR